ncbi:hypothetical protein [Aliivibrio fischeri]|uniref:hypothetical protein n=1 Tax=Aliivibrio fischeri TaxID=668 RepID=UPI00080E4C9B|nr:hypothetical protein [Aliivibrio fischeri]OCH30734.1 hypothetical protein A6D99_04260 [Aliivibrio fischeri]
MDLIINDIVWWKISLNSLINSWVPGIVTFFLGLWFSKISDRRKLRQELKNSILKLFIPIFNAGEQITLKQAEDTKNEMRITLNVYRNTYPKLLNKKSLQKLLNVLNEDIMIHDEINANYADSNKIQKMIHDL